MIDNEYKKLFCLLMIVFNVGLLIVVSFDAYLDSQHSDYYKFDIQPIQNMTGGNYTDSQAKVRESAVNVSINLANLEYLFEYQQVTNGTIELINDAWYNLSEFNINNHRYVEQYRIRYGKVNEGCMFYNDKVYEFYEELEHYEKIYYNLYPKEKT